MNDSNISSSLRRIRSALNVYFYGTLCFIIVSLSVFLIGVFALYNYESHNNHIIYVVFAIAGAMLMIEMLSSFLHKQKVPREFKRIERNDFPALFSLIDEATNILKLKPLQNVYLYPGASAAVFVSPNPLNLICQPEKNLLFGMALLTQMDDDEIRAVLYHELGHYVQKEIKQTAQVYSVSQMSRSFLSVRDVDKEGIWNLEIKSLILIYSCFTLWICRRINNAYNELALQMEYDADDVAVANVGAPTLQRALIHAACINYCYDAMEWGRSYLNDNGMDVDDFYAALRVIVTVVHPGRSFMPKVVMRRVARLGTLSSDSKQWKSVTVRTTCPSLFKKYNDRYDLCPYDDFVTWMVDGAEIYKEHLQLSKSVTLNIHLKSHRHKLPFFDASYSVLLDDKVIGYGNFIKGYTLKVHTSPQKHVITTLAPTSIRCVPIELNCAEGSCYNIELDYKFYKEGYYEIFSEKVSEITK